MENATVEINPNWYTVNTAGKTFTTITPAGDCMVGSQGDLYAVHDLTRSQSLLTVVETVEDSTRIL